VNTHQTAENEEVARLKDTRVYFEDGCACIHADKTLNVCPETMPDREAVAYYEQNCKCSRNYV
jgi:hypothetical protein